MLEVTAQEQLEQLVDTLDIRLGGAPDSCTWGPSCQSGIRMSNAESHCMQTGGPVGAQNPDASDGYRQCTVAMLVEHLAYAWVELKTAAHRAQLASLASAWVMLGVTAQKQLASDVDSLSADAQPAVGGCRLLWLSCSQVFSQVLPAVLGHGVWLPPASLS